MITDKMMPRAIKTLFNLSKKAKTNKLRIVPRVIILPSFPWDNIDFIPVIKSNGVKSVMNRKLPINVAMNPISSPMSKSILFIPVPGVKLLRSMMCCKVKLNRNN
jgi:hypothetical protein